jgi:hypothetical protein
MKFWTMMEWSLGKLAEILTMMEESLCELD